MTISVGVAFYLCYIPNRLEERYLDGREGRLAYTDKFSFGG